MRFKDSWILGPLSFDTTPLLGGETSPRLGAPGPFGVETWGGECNGWNGLKSWIAFPPKGVHRFSVVVSHVQKAYFQYSDFGRTESTFLHGPNLFHVVLVCFISFTWVEHGHRELRLQSFTTQHFELPGHGTQLREDVQVPPVQTLSQRHLRMFERFSIDQRVLPLPMFFPYILYILLNHGRLSGLLGLIFLEVLKFLFCLGACVRWQSFWRNIGVWRRSVYPVVELPGDTHGWHTIKQAAHVDGLPIL